MTGCRIDKLEKVRRRTWRARNREYHTGARKREAKANSGMMNLGSRVEEFNGEKDVSLGGLRSALFTPDWRLEGTIPKSQRESRRMVRVAKRQLWKYATFCSCPIINYTRDTKVTIGQMITACSYCRAKKWPCKYPRQCCLNGKLKQSEKFQSPSEYLK